MLYTVHGLLFYFRKIVEFERTRPSWAPEKFRHIKILTGLPVIRAKIADLAFFLVKCDLSFDLFVIRDNRAVFT